MSERERTYERDLLYSEWHRTDALKRYIAHRDAFDCAVIDIDWCEFCRKCKQPIALVEAQCSESDPKEATITSALARLAGIAAYSISYSKTNDGLDIEWFLVRQLIPLRTAVQRLLPEEWARLLFDLRLEHEKAACQHKDARRQAA